MLQVSDQSNSLQLVDVVSLAAENNSIQVTDYNPTGGDVAQVSSTLSLAERGINNVEMRNLCVGRNFQRVKLAGCRGALDLELFRCMTSLRDIHIDLEGEIRNIPCLQDLPHIRRIYLSSKTMSDTDVRPLCNIQTLEEITVCNSPNVVNLGNIGRLPHVHTLSVSRTGVIDEFLCGLTVSGSLRKIDLAQCERLTDIEPLASIKTLEEVDVSGCFPCVCGIGSLGTLPRLQVLDASLTGITDKCLAKLSASRSLRKLVLANCVRLTRVDRLDAIDTLQELDLAECSNLAHGIGSLGMLPALRFLDLSGTGLTNDGLCEISRSSTLQKLVLKRCTLLTDVTSLVNLTTLQHVNIGECVNIVDGFDVFSSLPSLRTLSMYYTAVTNENLNVISTSQSIVSLNIAACLHITDVSSLANLRTPEDVNINMCVAVEKGLDGVVGLPSLRLLSARSTAVDDGCVKIMSGCTNLERGLLEECIRIKDVTPLAGVKSLEYINLDRCPEITGVAELGKLPLLRVVSIREANISANEVKKLKSLNRRLYVEE